MEDSAVINYIWHIRDILKNQIKNIEFRDLQ